MKRLLPLTVAVCLACLAAGCSSTWTRLKATIASPAQHYRDLALAKEKEDRLHEAILLWKAVRRLEAGDKTAEKAIRKLKKTARERARRHFAKGVNAYQQGDFARARLHFLTTLRYRPDHRGALDYLKNRLHRKEQVSYRIRKGDSLSTIAYRTYKDAELAPVIAYFNDLDPGRPIFPGKVLILPTLPAEYLRPPGAIEQLIIEAREKFSRGDLDGALALIGQIEPGSPHYKEARCLADKIYFRQAAELMKHRQFWEALERLKRVRPGFKGRDKAMARARENLKCQAMDDRLKLARTRLEEGAYLEARTVVEEILASEPGNQAAKSLMDAINYAIANQLLAEGKDQEAIAVLETIDPAYEDTAVLINDAQLRLNAAAETHYRNGVKYFLNEELELAIEQWQAALRLNPNLDKARRDIANARRLLEKLEALETGAYR